MAAAPAAAAAGADTAELERRRTAANLRRLNDVLAATPMAGRTWVWAGLLLGWAREGDILLHDTHDVDLAYLGADQERFEATIPLLAEAGFRPFFRFPGLHGRATEYSFERDGAKFEFFRLDLEGDRFVYYNYGAIQEPPARTVRNRLEIPAQPLEEFRFLGRTWLKVRDHEAELTAKYGDWRTPDPGWSYLRSPDIVATTDWDPDTFDRWGEAYAAGAVTR